ncbi:MAG: peroxiredoxin-like family protein [Candidatus Sulfotelmatobacter sp.]|jgi:peroxiredoxin Q/BCP
MKNITETLGIGSTAPDFRLRSANTRETFSLSAATARGPVVLEFLRGTWCPNCRRRMAELAKMSTAVWQAGATLASIAAEKRDGMWEPEKYLQSHPMPFPFLLDEDRTVVKVYGVYHRIGVDAWDIAHPATLVIDRDGRIRYIFKGESQSDRSPVDEVLKALERTKGTSASG